MRDTIFPRWQGAFLAIFLLANGLYVPAAPAAVHTLALGTLLSAAVCFVWLGILSALDERDLDSLCRNRLPKIISLVLRLIIAAACAAGIWQSAARLAEFWQNTSFPGIPTWLSGAVLVFVGWRVGRRGRTAIAMWSYPMLFLCGFVILASLLITLPDCSPAHLSALIEAQPLELPMLWQFAWLPAPLLLCAREKNLPSMRACISGVLIGGGGLCLIALRAWLVLGAGAVKLPYPAFSAAGVFSIGDFLQRGEVVFGCALALCEAARAALFVCLLYWCWRYGRQDKEA